MVGMAMDILLLNDKDNRWQQAQSRGEAPMYTAIHLVE